MGTDDSDTPCANSARLTIDAACFTSRMMGLLPQCSRNCTLRMSRRDLFTRVHVQICSCGSCFTFRMFNARSRWVPSDELACVHSVHVSHASCCVGWHLLKHYKAFSISLEVQIQINKLKFQDVQQRFSTHGADRNVLVARSSCGIGTC